MLTVAKALVASNSEIIKIGEGEHEKFQYTTRFETLHSIDPSRFEQDQNIIEVIIAELFEKFQDRIKKDNGKDTEKRKVLKAFQDVYKCLKIISPSINSKNDKYYGDPLETLAKLADATKLEENIGILIKLYLQYLHPYQAANSSILIIPIDDFDLNVRHAGLMAEQIRKYLMIPQVLVLMAVNMEQFGDVKTQEVIADFKILMSESRMSESPRDIAARYILKLLPIERRIIIPSIRIERNEVSLLLHRGYEKDIDEKIVPKTIIGINDGDTFEKQLFNYIYKHTGLYFVSKNEEYHTFLPDTLRELRTLLSMLGSFMKLKEISDSNTTDSGKDTRESLIYENNKIKRENLEHFKNYFLNTWIKDSLLKPFKEMILDSNSIAYSKWNKFFITSTVEILSKEKNYKVEWGNKVIEKIYNNNDEIKFIIDRNNYPSNVSLGDLTYFFQFLNRIYINDKEIKRLLFSINCWYSLRLNLLYFNFRIKSHGSIEEPKSSCPEIIDIINGTIVNQSMGLIRNSKTLNRIQFPINYEKINPKSNFLDQNIFIKHKYESSYRRNESYIYKFDGSSPAFKTPTFNLFSFVYKDSKNIFPLPYNNLEYWISILENINKDFKDEANNADLISDLFKQIYSKFEEKSMQDNYKNNKILVELYNPIAENKGDTSAIKEEIEIIYKNAINDNDKLLKYLNDKLKEKSSIQKNSLIQGIRNRTKVENILISANNILTGYGDKSNVSKIDIKNIINSIEGYQ